MPSRPYVEENYYYIILEKNIHRIIVEVAIIV